MNKRIRELYKRAMVTVPANPGNKEFTWFDPEKFAELIIRECAGIADQAEPFFAYDLILKQFGLKHFGVEE